jgi:SAM-dependent methyltransferase
MSLIGQMIPRRLKDSLKVLLGYSYAIPIAKPHEENLFDCPVCGASQVEFDPLPMYYFRELFENQHIHPSFQAETINIEFFSCTNCHAIDRDRLYALYLRNNLSGEKRLHLLDIAPSNPLTPFLRKQENLVIRTADLNMEGVDDKVDITNMPIYKNESFDIFICSHVLEHIPEDLKAMKELYRILKPSGWGIIMVPILLGLKDIYENDEIIDAAGRWQHFGQDDHVRMYSKPGFIQRLQLAGFTVSQYGKDYFGPELFKKYGIHHRSILYIVSK